jgi:hypothetical protein
MLNRLFILLLLCTFLFSCTDDRAPSGISSMIYYGEGSCIPPINEAARVYKPFTGKVYVIEKSMADTMIDFLDSTSNKLYSAYATKGNFSVLVPPGTYYIMPDTLFYISAENLVTVRADDLIDREFKFFKCN